MYFAASFNQVKLAKAWGGGGKTIFRGDQNAPLKPPYLLLSLKSTSSSSRCPLGCLPYIVNMRSCAVCRWPHTWATDEDMSCLRARWSVVMVAEG